MGKATGIFFTSFSVLVIFNFVLALSGLVEIPVFSLWGVIGLIVTMIPIILLLSLSVEFHVLGTGGSTEGMKDQTLKIVFTTCTLIVLLFKFDLPAPIPFDIGLGLGSDILAVFSIADLGGIPFFICLGLVLSALISGIMISIE